MVGFYRRNQRNPLRYIKLYLSASYTKSPASDDAGDLTQVIDRQCIEQNRN